MPSINLGPWVNDFVAFLQDHFGPVLSGVGHFVRAILSNTDQVLLTLPWPLIVLVIALIAWYTAGTKVALFSAAALLFINALGIWDEAMGTLALVVTSTIIAIVVGLPLGILASWSTLIQTILRPILDVMQTMPSFVYLIPALILFGIGTTPAALATVVFAMPPAVRLTNLGIRQVPVDVIEAAKSFGGTRMQQLTKVQLPLALPTIMAGINQTIMLALSMSVIAAMIGAGGLGGIVFTAITRVNPGLGFEGGIAIVLMAIILDRITQSFAGPDKAAQPTY